MSFRTLLRLIVAGVITLAGTGALAADGDRPAVLLMPFDNFSGLESAPSDVSAMVVRTLTAKGWRVVAGESVEQVLEKDRVRYLDSFDEGMRKALLEASGTGAIVTGTIYRYSAGRNTVAALSARLIRADGTIGWADIAAVSSDDTERLFGFGRQTSITSVGDDAVAAVLKRFPRSGEQGRIVSGARKGMFRSGPVSYVQPDALPLGSGRRICILPFDNDSTEPDASRLITDILTVRLAASGDYEVVEPAVLREAALRAHVGTFRAPDTAALQRLAEVVRTPLFLRGTVYRLVDPGTRNNVDPEIEIELSLVDIRTGHVVWASQHERKGSDYGGLLLLGAITNPVSLADRAVSEIVAAELHLAAKSAKDTRNARATLNRPPEKHSALRRTNQQPGDKQ